MSGEHSSGFTRKHPTYHENIRHKLRPIYSGSEYSYQYLNDLCANGWTLICHKCRRKLPPLQTWRLCGNVHDAPQCRIPECFICR